MVSNCYYSLQNIKRMYGDAEVEREKTVYCHVVLVVCVRLVGERVFGVQHEMRSQPVIRLSDYEKRNCTVTKMKL